MVLEDAVAHGEQHVKTAEQHSPGQRDNCCVDVSVLRLKHVERPAHAGNDTYCQVHAMGAPRIVVDAIV